MRVHWANRLEEPCLSAGRDGNGFAEKLVRPVHMRVHWANRLEEPCLSAGRDGNGFAEKLVRPVHMRIHWANRLEEPCLSARRDGHGFAAAQNLDAAQRVVKLLVAGRVTAEALTQN